MAADARHYCDYPSCDKSFRRMEHLKRHQLNHTNRTIQCPKCSRIFYRNDLLQRHLTLKHRRGQRKSVSLEESSLNGDFPLDPVSSNRQNENLTSNPDSEPLESAEHALPNTHLTQGSGISPLSNLSSDQPDLLMIRSPVPFSPFTIENNGHNYDWAYQPPSNPASSSAIQGLETNHNLSQNPASHDALFEPVILQEFYLTPETHQELLSLIPVGNGGSLNTLDEFIRVLDMAVSRLADSLPILHRPTLNFEFLHRELSASILCFGLLASDQPDFYEIGCSLLHRLREDIILFTHNNTITMEQVWVLQAMLILEFGGMFYANRKAMELSDIFHGTMVTLARRLGIFEPSYEPARPSSSLSHDTRWLEWIHKESLKRLAYFIFVLDVKHALLFGHDRSIFSVFAIKLDLPCDNREWRAVGAHEWNAVIPSLVSGRLKCHEIHNTLLFSQEPDVDLPYLDALGAYIVFAGLSSITMDFLQRHHEPFFDRDKAIRRLCQALHAIHERLSSTPESKVKDHAQMIYYVSLISLYTPLDDLERAANSGYSLTGLTPKQQTRSAIVRLLTRNKVGVESARHATCLLRIYIPEDLRISSPYESSGLYLATLALWAYLTGKGYDHESPMLPSNNTDIEALNAMEISLEDSDMAACGKHWRTLVQHVADRLGRKYNENAREYSQVLRSLIDITI